MLEQAGLPFELRLRPVEENYPDDMPGEEVPVFLAALKARALYDSLEADEKERSLVISADTVVLLDGQILGKPADEAEATRFLQRLSGRSHEVVTGVALIDSDGEASFSEATRVYFDTLDDALIDHYVSAYAPLDKAGAYGIQEWIGLRGIEKIEGDFYNVMGLPVRSLLRALKARGAISMP